MSQLNNVRADMAVIGADGVAVGTVDGVTHHSIRLRPTGVRGDERFTRAVAAKLEAIKRATKRA